MAKLELKSSISIFSIGFMRMKMLPSVSFSYAVICSYILVLYLSFVTCISNTYSRFQWTNHIEFDMAKSWQHDHPKLAGASTYQNSLFTRPIRLPRRHWIYFWGLTCLLCLTGGEKLYFVILGNMKAMIHRLERWMKICNTASSFEMYYLWWLS